MARVRPVSPGASEGVPEEDRKMSEGHGPGPPASLTCPLCGGAVRETSEGGLPRFACHIGHRFAAAEFDAAQFRQVEEALEVALRVLTERAALCRRIAETQRRKGRPVSAEHWEAATHEVEERAEVLRRFIGRGWMRPDPDDEGLDGAASG
jgi:two-component system chemotaxis response regulator CheB